MQRPRTSGDEIHFAQEGDGTLVVLLHGLGSCSADWRMQTPAFAANHTVVAIDLRGHGESSKPAGPYTMAMLASDVARVIESLGRGPAHVVGISLGGMVAFQLAVDAPHLVKSLVIVNSAPEVVPRTLRERFAVAFRFFALRLLGLRWLGARIAAANFPDPDQVEARRALAERIASNDVRAYRATLGAIVGWSVADRISTIACPTLVVTADRDYTPVALKRAYAAKMADARVAVIERSRHVTPLDRPLAFNRVVTEFLADQDARAWREERVAGNA